jgi:ribosomal protein L15
MWAICYLFLNFTASSFDSSTSAFSHAQATNSYRTSYPAEVRLSDLAHVEGDVVDLNTLKAANIIGIQIEFAKVILSGIPVV